MTPKISQTRDPKPETLLFKKKKIKKKFKHLPENVFFLVLEVSILPHTSRYSYFHIAVTGNSEILLPVQGLQKPREKNVLSYNVRVIISRLSAV